MHLQVLHRILILVLETFENVQMYADSGIVSLNSLLGMMNKVDCVEFRPSMPKCNRVWCAPPFGYLFLLQSDQHTKWSCYNFYRESLGDRAQSKKRCSEINGTLVSIETKEEMEHLENVIKQNELFVKDWRISYWSGYWTSGMRLSDGTMIWEATGRNITYFKWGIAQPDQLVGQDYIFISNNFFWFDMEKSKEQAALCEQDARC